MPRHNLHKITPYVKALCDKYHIIYTEKSMSKAMLDIIRYGNVDINLMFQVSSSSENSVVKLMYQHARL